jgi:hypothetical protein
MEDFDLILAKEEVEKGEKMKKELEEKLKIYQKAAAGEEKLLEKEVQNYAEALDAFNKRLTEEKTRAEHERDEMEGLQNLLKRLCDASSDSESDESEEERDKEVLGVEPLEGYDDFEDLRDEVV